MRPPRSTLLAALTLTAAFVPALTVPSPAAAAPPGDRKVIVQLFQWKWSDVAEECENVLGPKGFGAVQISPPQEHVVLPNAGQGGYPWWQDYQPVSYPKGDFAKLTTRRGDVNAFRDMIARCHASGVKVYADAVINHTTGSAGGTGSAGTRFTGKYTYPGTFSDADFHTCRRDIGDYQDRWEVQNCELASLADLKTEDAGYVRPTLGGYLKDLASLGVDGFRIDAAKHIPAADIAAILGEMRRQIAADPAFPGTGTRDPYVYQEVLYGAGEPIRPSEYRANGDLKEVQAMNFLSMKFWTAGDPNNRLHQLHAFPVNWGDGMEPSDKAIVMVDNHDSQRDALSGRRILTYKNGAAYRLANVFLLAWDYGTPLVMSSFGFTQRDTSPPTDGGGTTKDVTCDGTEWICEHRLPEMADMVGFRNAVGNTPVNKADNAPEQDWYTDYTEGGPGNKIAFSRGDRGYVVINRDESTDWNRTYRTRLAPGRYCNVIGGGYDPVSKSCAPSHVITVAGDGTFTANVPRMTALAIHVNAKL
ncbi:alpha-amylase family protein [Actinomadura sp. NPDC047616]|uniref:alpha-amylase n=1 Tax=Actinomadura sp. NPDC047616 TaxID=3155914 RepID=UPI00340B81B7